VLFNCERSRGGLIAKIHVTNAVLKSLQAGKSHSGSGKSPQERRNTMAQPVSSVTGDLVKSSCCIEHSNDFEGHKSIQTNSWQQILLDLNLLYIGVLGRVTKS
jgi:hypothetical protein